VHSKELNCLVLVWGGGHKWLLPKVHNHRPFLRVTDPQSDDLKVYWVDGLQGSGTASKLSRTSISQGTGGSRLSSYLLWRVEV
jgi:hypothetical protein